MNNKLDGMSMNIEQTEMEKLKAVFPQCFAEGKLDIDKLLSLCGEYIDNDFEKYKFEWKGKIESLKLAQKRSTGTLRPCKAESVNFDETKNLYIEGDNLEVLKLLQTAYYNKIKMIYIDPPYNTTLFMRMTSPILWLVTRKLLSRQQSPTLKQWADTTQIGLI